MADTIKENGDDEDKDSPKVDGPLNIIEKGYEGGMDEKLSDSKEEERILNEDGFDGKRDIQKDITSFAKTKEYLITKGCEKTVQSKENILIYAQEFGVESPNLK